MTKAKILADLAGLRAVVEELRGRLPGAAQQPATWAWLPNEPSGCQKSGLGATGSRADEGWGLGFSV